MDEIRRNEIAWQMEVWRLKEMGISHIDADQIQAKIAERARELSMSKEEVAAFAKELCNEVGFQEFAKRL